MAKSSLIVTTEDHITGNTQQKTITDINPQANDAHLKTWGQMVAGLSKDSYVKSDRVDKRNLDTDSKTGRTLTLTLGGTYTFDLAQDSINIPLSAIDSTDKSIAGSLTVPANDTSKLIASNLNNLTFRWNQITYRGDITGPTSNFVWRFIFSQSDTPFSASVKFFLSNNNLYNAWEKTITINFVNGGEG